MLGHLKRMQQTNKLQNQNAQFTKMKRSALKLAAIAAISSTMAKPIPLFAPVTNTIRFTTYSLVARISYSLFVHA